jgi:hypothetical protein
MVTTRRRGGEISLFTQGYEHAMTLPDNGVCPEEHLKLMAD